MEEQVQTHTTSMAVWGAASPLVVDTEFTLKVGVKCAAGCNLAGEKIEIYDHEGARVATAALGDVPYADTTDLYWTEVTLTSPAAKGIYTWEVKLPKPSLKLPHEATSFKFGVSAAQPPKYAVTIEVVNQDTNVPVAHAHVMLRPYSGYTDDTGMLRLNLSDGEYRLYVTQGEYDTFQADVNIEGDATVRAEMTPAIFREDYRGNLWKVERRQPGGVQGRSRAVT